jgi:hypothetical protein
VNEEEYNNGRQNENNKITVDANNKKREADLLAEQKRIKLEARLQRHEPNCSHEYCEQKFWGKADAYGVRPTYASTCGKVEGRSWGQRCYFYNCCQCKKSYKC